MNRLVVAAMKEVGLLPHMRFQGALAGKWPRRMMADLPPVLEAIRTRGLIDGRDPIASCIWKKNAASCLLLQMAFQVL